MDSEIGPRIVIGGMLLACFAIAADSSNAVAVPFGSGVVEEKMHEASRYSDEFCLRINFEGSEIFRPCSYDEYKTARVGQRRDVVRMSGRILNYGCRVK